MRGLDEERQYAERCREAMQAMVTGARENVVVGEVTWGDRYTAERLGYYLKSLARELGDEGDSPPYFGPAHLRRHRPAAAGDRLARPGLNSLLPSHRDRPPRHRRMPPLRLVRHQPDGLRGRTAH